VDLHIHDTHFIAYACGVPDAVIYTGLQQHGVVKHLTTLYVYGTGGPCVSCTSGALSRSAFTSSIWAATCKFPFCMV